MILKNYWWTFEGALPARICDDILEYGKSLKDEKAKTWAYRGKDLTPDVEKQLEKKRNSNVVWMNPRWIYREIQPYADIANKTERMEMIRKDPYLNALQVKFAYALTCHKAQGGQWKAVFVDQGYLPDDTVDKDFIRWLYTAVTRSSEELYLVNFSQGFFVKNSGI